MKLKSWIKGIRTSGTKDDLITWKTPPRPPAEGCSPTQEDAADGAPLPLSARGTGTRLDVERNGDSSPLVPMDNADSEEGGQEMMASQSEDPFSPNFVAPVVKKFSQNGHVEHPRPSRLVDGDDTSAPPHRPSTGGSLRNEDSSYTTPVVPPRRGSSGYTPVSSSPAPPVVQTPPVQPPPHRHSVRSTPPPPSRHPEPLTGILVSDAERDELVQENQQLKDRVKELERLLEEEKSTSSSLREDIESNSVLVNLQFEALDQFQTIFQQQQNKIKELEEFLRKERKDLEEEESNLNRVLDKYSRLKDEKKHWEEAALKLQDKYQRLKSEIEEFRREAEGKISITNRELEDLGQQKEMDDARLQAMVRKAESRVSSLEQQLKLKSDEAAELSSICEDLLKRRKQHGK